MFKRSVCQAHSKSADSTPYEVRKGWVEVRTNPQSPPPLLKQRLIDGEDAISIWFKHTHAKRFQDLDDWRGIKILAPKEKEKTFIPQIDEMSSLEILEFCKSIDVHPAHLVPLDDDPRLSLSTPLIELLVNMSYRDISDGVFAEDNVHLAKVALAQENERIKRYLAAEKNVATLTGTKDRLQGVFQSVLKDASLMCGIINVRVDSYSKRFGMVANVVYPLWARARDAAIHREDVVSQKSIKNMDRQAKRVILCQKDFQGFYRDFFGLNVEEDVTAEQFLVDIKNSLAQKKILPASAPPKEIEKIIRRLKSNTFDCANGIFVRDYAEFIETEGFDIGYHLRELDKQDISDLVTATIDLLNAEYELENLRKRHDELEGEYISRTAEIRRAFDEENFSQRKHTARLIANMIILRMYNIDASIQVQAEPK